MFEYLQIFLLIYKKFVYDYSFNNFFSLIIGNVKLNIAPLPSESFSAHVLPPCTSIIFLQMYSPNPVPVLESLVVNFENNLGNISFEIPFPVSLTLTIASSFPSSLSFLLSTITNIISLLDLVVNLKALSTKL